MTGGARIILGFILFPKKRCAWLRGSTFPNESSPKIGKEGTQHILACVLVGFVSVSNTGSAMSPQPGTVWHVRAVGGSGCPEASGSHTCPPWSFVSGFLSSCFMAWERLQCWAPRPQLIVLYYSGKPLSKHATMGGGSFFSRLSRSQVSCMPV